jgi:hypothetical protein
VIAPHMASADAVVRLGLGVVGADDYTVRVLGSGVYAVATRDARPIADTLVGPCATPLVAAGELAARLAGIRYAGGGVS